MKLHRSPTPCARSDLPPERRSRPVASRRRRNGKAGPRGPGTPWRGIALAELAWLGTTAVLTAERVGYWEMIKGNTPWNLVWLEATVSLTWSMLLPMVILVSLRWPLGRRGIAWAAHLTAFAAAVLIEAIVYVVIDDTLLHVIPLGFGNHVRNTVVGHLVASLKIYGVIACTTHAYVYRRLFQDRQLRAARLETQLARSELQVLRSQLHPHFLFNALHAVSTLMHRDVEAADTMLARLSDLLRASLTSAGTHEVPLKEELQFLERYIDIERTRFRDRLVVRIDAEPGTLDACVPHLLLQPLVENAIHHGVGPRPGPGIVEVRAWRSGEDLRLLVRDDGLGAAALASDNPSGIGLANTRRRLRRLYGRSHGFRASPSPGGGFRVSLRLPFHTEPLTVFGAGA